MEGPNGHCAARPSQYAGPSGGIRAKPEGVISAAHDHERLFSMRPPLPVKSLRLFVSFLVSSRVESRCLVGPVCQSRGPKACSRLLSVPVLVTAHPMRSTPVASATPVDRGHPLYRNGRGPAPRPHCGRLHQPDLRSLNGQIEFVLRDALRKVARLERDTRTSPETGDR